jgi:hypothetical protein
VTRISSVALKSKLMGAMLPRRLLVHGDRLFTILCALITIFVVGGAAQISSTATQRGGGIHAAASPTSAMNRLTVTPPPPEPPLTRQEMPPNAPQVSWDGEQLTIMADNATLSDILAAVHACIGAEIDIPASASHERMSARLGPGPAREVLSSLLAWMDFNYIIQASDTDSKGIQSVVLTRRQNTTTVVAGNPGSYARSANRGVAEPNSIPEGGAERGDGPAPPEPTTAGVQAASVVQTGSAPPEPQQLGPTQFAEGAQSVAPQLGSTDQQSGAAAPRQAAAADVPAAAPMPSDPQTASGAPESNSNQTRPAEGMIQDLQRMYQQRLQLQQGQKSPPSS